MRAGTRSASRLLVWLWCWVYRGVRVAALVATSSCVVSVVAFSLKCCFQSGFGRWLPAWPLLLASSLASAALLVRYLLLFRLASVAGFQPLLLFQRGFCCWGGLIWSL